MKKLIALSLVTLFAFSACKKDTKNTTTTSIAPSGAQLKFVFKFDSTQARLNNFGQPSTFPPNHQAQSPKFNSMSSHYVELAPDSLTALGAGVVLYKAPEVPKAAGSYTSAIDFSQSVIVGQGEAFLSIPLSSIKPGTYKWMRVSLAYQNYDIKYVITNTALPVSPYAGTGTIASFVGFSTYLTSYKIKTQTVSPNSAELQGYWGFETSYTFGGTTTYTTTTGQSPAGATTVVNPISASSPIPAGSCVETGRFVGPTGKIESLVIIGNETQDITITVSLSTNKSFEWIEHTGDSNFNPANGDTVVDMGLRGLIPILPQ
jgi:hypothetical protein